MMVNIPKIPNNKPASCRKLNLAFSHTIDITKANNGVVEFKIDKVPALKTSAELAKRRKGNTA